MEKPLRRDQAHIPSPAHSDNKARFTKLTGLFHISDICHVMKPAALRIHDAYSA